MYIILLFSFACQELVLQVSYAFIMLSKLRFLNKIFQRFFDWRPESAAFYEEDNTLLYSTLLHSTPLHSILPLYSQAGRQLSDCF